MTRNWKKSWMTLSRVLPIRSVSLTIKSPERNTEIKCFFSSVVSFETGDQMEERLNQDNAMKRFLVGVRFDNIKPNSTLPKSTIVSTVKLKLLFYAFISYSTYNLFYIMWDTNFTYLVIVFNSVQIKLRYPCHLRITKKSLMSFDTIEANWRTYLMFPLYQTFGPRHKSENDGGEPGINP